VKAGARRAGARQRFAETLSLAVLHRYLGLAVLGNLAWEALHLPLYTVSESADPGYLVFVVLHCTGGDLMIALGALLLAVAFASNVRPRLRFPSVVALTAGFAVSYTVFSEWLNVEVRRTWAYTDLMPTVPIIDTGLSPIMQWLVIPPLALWYAKDGRGTERRGTIRVRPDEG